METTKIGDIIPTIFTPRSEPKGYKFAVIRKNNDLWFDPSNPARRIEVIGFFDDSGKEIDANDELCKRANRALRNCGEFADTLTDNIDYISI